MGLRILSGLERGTAEPMACMYDSVTGWAFGPVFERDDAEEACQQFIDWLPQDARIYQASDLERLYGEWLETEDRDGRA